MPSAGITERCGFTMLPTCIVLATVALAQQLAAGILEETMLLAGACMPHTIMVVLCSCHLHRVLLPAPQQPSQGSQPGQPGMQQGLLLPHQLSLQTQGGSSQHAWPCMAYTGTIVTGGG